MKNRRRFLKTSSSGLLFLSFVTMLNCRQKKVKPNVLFIAVDDLRPQLGCYGHKQMKSPNIDRLASEGTLFRNTFCQVPVCGASRAGLLTGVRPTRERFVTYFTWADKDLPGNTSLPMHFKNNGYTTISNGKVFHHLTDGEGSWTEPAWNPDGRWQDYVSAENLDIAEKTEGGFARCYENADVKDNAYWDGKVVRKSIDDMKRLSQNDQPFFLAVGFRKPHLPFNAPQKYWDMYDRDKIDLADNPFRPKDAPDAAMHNFGELRAYTDIPKQGPIDDQKARTLIHGYYACVSYIDAQVGKLLDALQDLELRKNTIVVLWGDHGWNLGEHGLWCKHCNFDTALKAPLIVSAPGFKTGQSTKALTEFVDIYPALCELAGLDIPEHCQGSSFVPLLKNPDKKWKPAIFSRYFDGETVKTAQYAYTEWTDKNGEVYARMLYDHVHDPKENINIAEQQDRANLVDTMAEILHEGWQGVKPQ